MGLLPTGATGSGSMVKYDIPSTSNYCNYSNYEQMHSSYAYLGAMHSYFSCSVLGSTWIGCAHSLTGGLSGWTTENRLHSSCDGGSCPSIGPNLWVSFRDSAFSRLFWLKLCGLSQHVTAMPLGVAMCFTGELRLESWDLQCS